MFVTEVSLLNFRNYQEERVALNPGATVLHGENAQGKTNFLESVFFAATGRSYRTNFDRELIDFGQDSAHVQVKIARETFCDKIDAQITRDRGKAFAVDGIPVKKLGDLFGVLLTVLFSPEDLNLIKAGPAERRRYLDMELCQLSPVYYYELSQYYKVLRQRNSLLKEIGRVKTGDQRSPLRDTLFVWDEQLAEHGVKIIGHRKRFLEKISVLAGENHASITGGREKLEMVYKPGAGEDGGEYLEKLRRGAERDILTGMTNLGAHKDDVAFVLNGCDARTYGSQGQQRTAALSAKLSQIALIREEKREDPVLLLDDVFSELDHARQVHLLDSVGSGQVILTCTGVEDVLRGLPGHVRATCLEVRNGRILL